MPESARPGIPVVVIMRREPLDNRWQPFRWVLHDVQPDVGQFGPASVAAGEPPVARLLAEREGTRDWLYQGHRIELFRDEAEGYYLNASSPAPCWFVMWRLQDDVDPEAALAVPHRIMLSYNEAGRLLDGGETVENVPLDTGSRAWLEAYVAEYYKPEPKKRRRPQSFIAPGQRATD